MLQKARGQPKSKFVWAIEIVFEPLTAQDYATPFRRLPF
jgi:hypothetical protein